MRLVYILFFLLAQYLNPLFANPKDELTRAILLLENQNIQFLENLELKQKEILHISELSAGGRYLRYEIAGKEAYNEIRHISGNLKNGLIFCKVETVCGDSCEQRDFACFLVKEQGNNLIQVQLAVNLPRAPERSVAEEDECPTKKRISFPREEKSETIFLDFFCEKDKLPIFLERKTLSFSEILASLEKN